VANGRIARPIVLAAALMVLLLAPACAGAVDAWFAPVHIDSASGGNTLTSVSCVSPTFCVAVDNGGNNSDGHALYFDGVRWSAPALMDTDEYGPVSVSCPTSSFCMAVDGSAGTNGGGSALMFNGHTWTAPAPVSSSGLSAVSCASSSFCVAVNQDAYDWHGTSWGNGTLLNGGEGYQSVSCPVQAFCAAVGHNGGAVIWNGAGWSSASQVETNTAGDSILSSVSCVGVNSCITVDGNGNFFYYEGAWTPDKHNPLDPNGQGLASISCPSASPGFCMAVDGAGNAWEFTGSWSRTSIDPNGQGLTGVSCASSSFCVAVDTVGNALEYGPACVVPKLKADTLRTARSALGGAGCALGRTIKRKSTIAKGRVISSSPGVGAVRPVGTRVTLVLSSGRPKRRKR
jgi:hypothetical protein